jgi:carnitine O-acetyltransferase
MTESHGDYRDDDKAFLDQDDTDTPLYRYQRQLPRLPVPTLGDTIERFLPTALPLAESEEEVVSLRRACREFIDEAKPLQQRLLERQTQMKNSSWLQSWWNTMGYLQVRDPIVIFVSYFFQLPDDSMATTGIQRGAAVLRASTGFCQRASTGTLPQDTVSNTPLCSAAYKYMFHACRTPKPHQDTYRIYKPTAHAIVTCRNQFFIVPVLDDHGDILPLSTLEKFLQECDERAKQTPNQLELGWLTTSNRDDWARAHTQLLRIGGQDMERALQHLESGMLVLCLDDEEPVSYRQRALEYWHGGMQSGGNRWFDKSIQLVVSRNGKLGYIGEHSMMDGMPAVGLCQHLKTQSYAKQMASQNDTLSTSCTRGVVNLFQETCSNLSAFNRQQIEALVSKGKSTRKCAQRFRLPCNLS